MHPIRSRNPLDLDPVLLGRTIRLRRQEAQLSQWQVIAPAASAAYLSRIEAGKRVPSLSVLQVIARNLECDVAELVDGCHVPSPHVRLSLGSVIRRRRLERGLTQSDVAGTAFTAAYLSRLEAGDRTGTHETLTYIADRLEVPLEVLLCEAEGSQEPEPSMDFVLASRVARAAAGWLASPSSRGYAQMDRAAIAWDSEPTSHLSDSAEFVRASAVANATCRFLASPSPSRLGALEDAVRTWSDHTPAAAPSPHPVSLDGAHTPGPGDDVPLVDPVNETVAEFASGC
jgi:transcriptional regulator with XRE-family HTH domain